MGRSVLAFRCKAAAAQRQKAYVDDPRRFVLASEHLPSFVLYYDVSDNVYVMNDLSAATVFKKRTLGQART